jgi:hypothetical protein
VRHGFSLGLLEEAKEPSPSGEADAGFTISVNKIYWILPINAKYQEYWIKIKNFKKYFCMILLETISITPCIIAILSIRIKKYVNISQV